jgi:alkanesulfonate monooxygenase SsuD/methylene tetrahydromethanopterin reductase-like flavin-dependent oxidoreductase (luciferase family)
MARVGFATGYDARLSNRDMAHWMREAEQRGFEIGFFSETIELNRDSVSALATFAVETERMTLGCTQIVRLRSPLVMAQTLASLDELSGGRIMLSPGACTKTHSIRNGLEHVHPPTALREYVDAMRLILTGDKVSYHGEVVHFDDVELGWTPVRTHIPMYLPATSAPGLRLAGEIADGVLLNAVCSPEYDRNALKIVRDSLEAAGRDWSEFKVAQLINCSIEDDHDTAVREIKWEVASKLGPNQVRFIAKPKMRVGEPYIHEEDLPVFEEAWNRGGKDALIEAVPDSYVEGMTASGTPDEVKARIEEYREAGVDLPILRPAAAHQTQRLLDLFAPEQAAAPA